MSNDLNMALVPSSLGKAVLARVCLAADHLPRTEFLDEEQRSEIHTILEAIRHECERHAHPAETGTYVPARAGGVERGDLQQQFADIRLAVLTAAEHYARQAAQTPDGPAKDQLDRLSRDATRHVELADRLLEIVYE